MRQHVHVKTAWHLQLLLQWSWKQRDSCSCRNISGSALLLYGDKTSKSNYILVCKKKTRTYVELTSFMALICVAKTALNQGICKTPQELAKKRLSLWSVKCQMTCICSLLSLSLALSFLTFCLLRLCQISIWKTCP